MIDLKSSYKQSDIDHYSKELYLCRKYPLYFIFNYVYIPHGTRKIRYESHLMQPKIRRVVRIVDKYHKCILMASRQLGKALDINTPIPQPDGKWTLMKDLNVGDFVIDSNGNPIKVIATTDIMHNHDCYEIEFDYGEKIIADKDHIWIVGSPPFKLIDAKLTTEELYKLASHSRSNSGNPYITLSKPIKNKRIKLPIDPYFLGIWLGDGSKSQMSIAISESDYPNVSKELINRNIDITEYKQKYDKPSGYFNVRKQLVIFRKLNLLNNKHIPRIYFQASIKQRLDLLRGLMDSDGYCSKDGSCSFSQRKYDLTMSVQELLSSLGIKSRIKYRIIKGQKYYDIKFCTRKFYVFNLMRKRNLQKTCKNHIKNKRHYIKSIKQIESVPVKCIQVDSQDSTYLCGKHMIPTHNSTIAACIIAWSLVFYPRNKVVILNIRQDAGKENLERIKFIISNLPGWMIGKKPFISSDTLKTYFELYNGSTCKVFYPSTVHPPSTVARSLTIPCLYIDEAAHIRDIDDIYSSAQPTLSTARQQAESYGEPYFLLVTSTPNGSVGDGEWFYDKWENSVDSDLLFNTTDHGDDIWDTSKNLDNIVSDPAKNTFIRIKYHWKEDPRKDDQWYQEQCQELRKKNNSSAISQELDLEFVAPSNSIFTPELLREMRSYSRPPIDTLLCPHGSIFKIYDKVDPKDYYIIGCDTAESLTAAYCAIQIFGTRTFSQLGELQSRLGSFKYFSDIIHFVFQWLHQQVGDRILLSIENNSIGRAPIENLLYHIPNFDYTSYLFKQKHKDDVLKEQYGIKTTGANKDLLIGILIEQINEYKNCIKSSDLIDQCSAMVRTATGTPKSSTYTDLFMASCFCSYARRHKLIELMPMINQTDEQLNTQAVQQMKKMTSLMSEFKNNKKDNRSELFNYENVVFIDDNPDLVSDSGFFNIF